MITVAGESTKSLECTYLLVIYQEISMRLLRNMRLNPRCAKNASTVDNMYVYVSDVGFCLVACYNTMHVSGVPK